MNRRIAAIVLLTCVVALAVGVLLHLRTPSARRCVRTTANTILASTLAGRVEIDALERIGIDGFGGARVKVHDPTGVEVLAIDGVTVRIAGLAIARSALLGRGPGAIDDVAIEIGSIDANLDGGPDGALRIANAFAPKVEKPPAPPAATFTADGFRRGIVAHLPLTVFGAAFGFAFGAAAIDRGMSPLSAGLMSLVVFAGASQFAVLDLWREPLPLVAITLTTLAVNARHLMLGAAIAPWLNAVPPLRRYVTAIFLSDANFARSLQAKTHGERDVAFLFGGGLLLWLVWVVSTLAGALVGSAIGDLGRYGLDMVMVVFFAATIVSLWRGRADLWPWMTAALVSSLGSLVLPAGWHIIAGALAGGAIGALRHGR